MSFPFEYRHAQHQCYWLVIMSDQGSLKFEKIPTSVWYRKGVWQRWPWWPHYAASQHTQSKIRGGGPTCVCVRERILILVQVAALYYSNDNGSKTPTTTIRRRLRWNNIAWWLAHGQQLPIIGAAMWPRCKIPISDCENGSSFSRAFLISQCTVPSFAPK
jgi:hypothetical protein